MLKQQLAQASSLATSSTSALGSDAVTTAAPAGSPSTSGTMRQESARNQKPTSSPGPSVIENATTAGAKQDQEKMVEDAHAELSSATPGKTTTPNASEEDKPTSVMNSVTEDAMVTTAVASLGSSGLESTKEGEDGRNEGKEGAALVPPEDVDHERVVERVVVEEKVRSGF